MQALERTVEMAKGSGGVGKGGKAGSVSGAVASAVGGALNMAGVPGYVKELGETEAKAWAGIQAAMKKDRSSLVLMTDAIKESGLSKEAFHGAARRMWDQSTKGFIMHNNDLPSEMSARARAGAMVRTFGSDSITFHAVSVPE
jgi:hypothetical protein